MAGVSAIALAGCNTSGGGFNGNANAILGSGQVTSGNVASVSSAATDSNTSALVSFDDNGTPTVGTDDSITVSVNGGGAVAGPTKYVLDSTASLLGSTATTNLSNEGFAVLKTATPSNSILVASVGDYGFAGFVGANDSTTGVGNIATAYGSVEGVGPTGTVPIGSVGYTGGAAEVVQTVGSTPSYIAGTSSISANFTSGAVTGTMDFSGTADDVGFTGTMNSSKATYSSSAVTLGGVTGTGQLQGGFFGPDYVETDGSFDVGNTAGTTKVTGAFHGSVAP